LNFVKLMLITLSAFVLIGCGDKRESTVQGMFDALSNGDIQELSEYTTQSTYQLLIMGSTMQCGNLKNSFDDEEEMISNCLEKVFENVEIEDIEIKEISDTRARATVTELKNGKKMVEHLNLIKRDGDWKVNIQK